MALSVGIPVAVCSDSDSPAADHQVHHHQRATVDDVVESPAALQLLRRSANYEPTTWDYDSICCWLLISRRPLPHPHDHELLPLPLPLPLGSQQDADDAIAIHLPLVATDMISSEMESVQVQASFKDSVRRMLLLLLHHHQEEEEHDVDDDRSSRLRLLLLLRTIHQLQSLGVAYHFHQEIRGILLSLHRHQHQQHLDLHSAALLFRMLRELGIPASTEMLLSALREEEEAAGDDKITDSDALLALYQASYLAFPGETALDQARAFAVGKLLAAAGRYDDSDSDSTGHHHLPLSLPLHWTAPRLQAMWSLTKDDDHVDVDPAILQLAQVDFNLVQALHRRELAEVTRWWKESRLAGGEHEHSLACRDRVVECFFCAACIAPEPRLAECREVLAKTGALIVHLDDIYDVYGTSDELQAFTDAIAGWERHCDDDVDSRAVVDVMDDDMAALPEYMKAVFSAIWTTSAAAADRVLEKHGYDMLPLYKKAWHELCKAFLVEAQWQQQGHMPSFAEYVSNGWITSTGPLLLLHALPAAGILPITQQTQGANGIDYPRLVELSSTIFRLCNDCATHEAESERGDVAPSSIACCMAEPWCAGDEEKARAVVQGVIAETWKALNREVVAVVASAARSGGNENDPCSCSSSSSSSSAAEAEAEAESMTTTMASLCLNLARIIHCIYQDGDGITSPTRRMKQMVKDLLFNPIHDLVI